MGEAIFRMYMYVYTCTIHVENAKLQYTVHVRYTKHADCINVIVPDNMQTQWALLNVCFVQWRKCGEGEGKAAASGK